MYEKKVITSDLALLTSNTIQDPNPDGNPPKLHIHLGPDKVDYMDFVAQGWRSAQGKDREWKETIEAREVKLIPRNRDEHRGKWFSIDSENFEAKSVKITLLPKMIQMFCKSNKSIPVLS